MPFVLLTALHLGPALEDGAGGNEPAPLQPVAAWTTPATAPGEAFAATLSLPDAPPDQRWEWSVEAVETKPTRDAEWGDVDRRLANTDRWEIPPTIARAPPAAGNAKADDPAAATLRVGFPEFGYWRVRLRCTGTTAAGTEGEPVAATVWTEPAVAAELRLPEDEVEDVVQSTRAVHDIGSTIRARVVPPDLTLDWAVDHHGRLAVCRISPGTSWEQKYLNIRTATYRRERTETATLELDPTAPDWPRWTVDQNLTVSVVCREYPALRAKVTVGAMKFARADELDRIVTAPGSWPVRIVVPAGEKPERVMTPNGPRLTEEQKRTRRHEMWHGWDRSGSWAETLAPGENPSASASQSLNATGSDTDRGYVQSTRWNLGYYNHAVRPEGLKVGRPNRTVNHGTATCKGVGTLTFTGTVSATAEYGGWWDDSHLSAAAGVHAVVGSIWNKDRTWAVPLTGAAVELRHGAPYVEPGSPVESLRMRNRDFPPPQPTPVIVSDRWAPQTRSTPVRGSVRFVLATDDIRSFPDLMVDLTAAARTVQTGDDDWTLAADAEIVAHPPGDVALYFFPGHGDSYREKEAWRSFQKAIPEDELVVPHMPAGGPGRAGRIDFLAVLPLFSAGIHYRVDTDRAGSERLIDGLFAPWEAKATRLREFGGLEEPAAMAWSPLETALLAELRRAVRTPLFEATDTPRPARFDAWEAVVRAAVDPAAAPDFAPPAGYGGFDPQPTAAVVRRVRDRVRAWAEAKPAAPAR